MNKRMMVETEEWGVTALLCGLYVKTSHSGYRLRNGRLAFHVEHYNVFCRLLAPFITEFCLSDFGYSKRVLITISMV